MTITRSNLTKELVPGLHALVGMGYDMYDNEYKEFLEVESSDRAFEEETMLADFEIAPYKQEGAAIAYSDANEVWTARYLHKTFGLAFEITEEAMEDNLYDKLSVRYAKALGEAMGWAKEVTGANVLNNSTSSSYIGGDKVALLSTVHPTMWAGTYANRPTASTDLSETALEDAINSIALLVNERGRPLALQAKKLIVPQVLAMTSQRILKTTDRVGTADNDLNAIRTMGLIPQGFAVNHYLTSTHAWYLTTSARNGLKFFQRIKLSKTTDGDFETGNFRYKCRERYSVGWTDPRGIFGSP